MSSLRGLIFNIQRFSIHDGPGCRTLVFFKGCPLRCLWCCNPEGQRGSPEIFFHRMKCIRCGTCLEVCPEGAIRELNEVERIDRERCTLCGECTSRCPPHALEMKGEFLSVEQVMDEVKKDWLFYRNSGGGVTLGGGEPAAQANFAQALLKECRKEDIHTAVETCGYANWSNIKKILDYTDLFLYDIKVMDPYDHKEYTGKGNELILQNARRIAEHGVPLIIRVPVIPRYNDSEENIKRIVRFAKGLKSDMDVELLPYHRFGESKYEAMGRTYQLTGVQSLSDEEIENLKSIV